MSEAKIENVPSGDHTQYVLAQYARAAKLINETAAYAGVAVSTAVPAGVACVGAPMLRGLSLLETGLYVGGTLAASAALTLAMVRMTTKVSDSFPDLS